MRLLVLIILGNDKVFYIKNNTYICNAIVVNSVGGFCTIRVGNGAIRLRENKLFSTEKEALEILEKYRKYK